MAKKKVSKQKAQNNDKLIQSIGAALIVVVVAAFAFPYLSKMISNANQPQASAPVSDAPACASFAEIPAAAQYSQPPMKINPAAQYSAVVKLQKGGQFTIQLYADKAPITVNSFVFLACKEFFSGVTFHRVLEGFMAQGGDPTGTGSGGPGYEFEYEGSDLTFDKAGVVAMANTGPATPTNGSQFFITFAPAEFLNDGYTIFGQVVEGMDVVNGITRRDPQENPSFEGDAMESVTIVTQ